MNIFDLSAKLTLDSSDYTQGISDAERGFTSFGGKLRTGLATATVIGGAAVAAATTAVVGLTKQAVSAYGEYEQLVGGVETLFKDSSDTVMEYAANAYKTAGLSANEYMSTVTSFSASLLQGLGGDTAEAAKVADMAITDMADNANKMGTDISMIQNAYQGFAKQNYTMLDNLKLGYGGTKTEMERLLADAEELTGVHYDIGNLNDVYEAIHAIQGELGITGTTAKEAESTIQGSMSAMKSSWQNLLVAFADGNADISENVNQLVSSVSTVLGNLLPVIQTALSGVVTAIKDLAPQVIAILPDLINDILPELLNAVMGMTRALADVTPDIILTITTALLDNLPELVDAAVQIMLALIDGLTVMIPELIPVALQAVQQLTTALLNNLPLLISAAGQLIGGLLGGIIRSLPQVASTAGQVIKQLASAFKPSEALKWGADMISGFVKGIRNMLPSVGSAASSIASKVRSFLHFSRPDEGPLRDYEQWMPDFINGMVEGIEENEDKLSDAVQGMADNMVITSFSAESPTSKVPISSPITINVYATENQNVNELADVIERRLANKMSRSGAVYA